MDFVGHLYLRRDTVFIPTMAVIENELYVDVEPVRITSTVDQNHFFEALRAAINAGNPAASRTDAANSRPVVLKYAKLTSWQQFEKTMMTWKFQCCHDGWKLVTYRPHRSSGFIEGEEIDLKILPPMIDLAARKIVDMVRGSNPA